MVERRIDVRRENEEFRRKDCSCRDRSVVDSRMREGGRRSGGAGPGSGSGLSARGDGERPHPPRFIDRVTPLAGALANFPPYLWPPPSPSLGEPFPSLSLFRPLPPRLVDAFSFHGAPSARAERIMRSSFGVSARNGYGNVFAARSRRSRNQSG